MWHLPYMAAWLHAGPGGISCFIVEKDSPGLGFGEKERKVKYFVCSDSLGCVFVHLVSTKWIMDLLHVHVHNYVLHACSCCQVRCMHMCRYACTLLLAKTLTVLSHTFRIIKLIIDVHLVFFVGWLELSAHKDGSIGSLCRSSVQPPRQWRTGQTMILFTDRQKLHNIVYLIFSVLFFFFFFFFRGGCRVFVLLWRVSMVEGLTSVSYKWQGQSIISPIMCWWSFCS